MESRPCKGSRCVRLKSKDGSSETSLELTHTRIQAANRFLSLPLPLIVGKYPLMLLIVVVHCGTYISNEGEMDLYSSGNHRFCCIVSIPYSKFVQLDSLKK